MTLSNKYEGFEIQRAVLLRCKLWAIGRLYEIQIFVKPCQALGTAKPARRFEFAALRPSSQFAGYGLIHGAQNISISDARTLLRVWLKGPHQALQETRFQAPQFKPYYSHSQTALIVDFTSQLNFASTSLNICDNPDP